MQLANVRGQGRLVAYRRGHPAQQRRYFAARLDKAENVIDEQQYVLVLYVPEVLRHGQSRFRYTHTRPRWLVHLTEHQSCVVDDTGFRHFYI